MILNEIISIFNWALLGVFLLLILFLIIAMLTGLKRGVFKSTFRLFFMIILIITTLATLDLQIDAVGNIPIDWINKYVVITINESGESIAIATSTVFGTLKDVMGAFLQLFGFNASPNELFALSIGLARMVLKYAMFIVDMLLIVTLGNLLCSLLWHLIFKHFIPKTIRKIVKVKWLSFFEEGVRFILVAGMMIVPFSSLLNTINGAWQKNKTNSENEILVTVGGFIDVYNNSVIAQTLFNWTTNGTSVTFDTSILNSFTSVTINGVTTSLMDQVSNVAELGVILYGALKEGNELAIDTSYLLSTETLNALFTTLNNSGIITFLLPVAATLALNSDLLSEYVDTSLLNLSDVDWKKEIINIETMTIDILNSGLLTSFLDEDGGVKDDFDFGEIVQSMLSDESHGYMMSLLQKIDDSVLLNRALPAVISTLVAANNDIAAYFPATWPEMNTIKWGNELSILYDSLFRINKIDNSFVSLIMDMAEIGNFSDESDQEPLPLISSNHSTPSVKRSKGGILKDGDDDDPVGNPFDDILEIVSKNAKAIKTILIGEFDSKGNLVNCTADGVTKVYDASGNKIVDRRYNLFDMSLMKYIFPILGDMMVNTIKDQTGEALELDEAALKNVIYDLSTNGPRVKNYKEEFSHLIDTMVLIQGSEKVLGLLDATLTIDGFEAKDIDKLKEILISTDDSKILSAVLKPSLKNILTGPSMSEKFAKVGVNTDKFNFNVPKLGFELAHLLGSFAAINEIIEDFSGGGSANEILKTLSEKYENLALLLDTIFDSEIINPKDDFYDGDLENNYFDFLNYIFGETGSSTMPTGLSFKEETVTLHPSRHGVSHGWSNSRNVYGDYYRDKFGNPIFDGENGYLANVIATLATVSSGGESILDVFSDPGYNIAEHLADLDSVFNIGGIMTAVDKSSIFSATFGDFLDYNLDSINLVNVDQGITFNNVDNWEVEGENFSLLCKSIGELGSLDFASLDVMKITNIGALNKTLHALANSGVFVDKRDGSYLFNVFLYDKLLDTLTDLSSDNYLNDPGTDADPTYNLAMSDFEISQNGAIYTSGALQETWNAPHWISTYINLSGIEIEGLESDPAFIEGFYKSDEIGKISYFLREIQDAKNNVNAAMILEGKPTYDNPVDALTSGKVKSEQLGKVMLSMNDVKALRILVYHSFDHILETISFDSGSSSGTFSLQNANLEYLLLPTTTKELRDDEINLTISIVSNLEKTNLLDDPSSLSIENLILNPNISYYLYESLIGFQESYIFHRAGPRNAGARTSFQDAIYYYYSSDSIQKIYYQSTSPKDASNYGIYTNALEKAEYNIKDYFTYGGGANNEDQIFEIGRIIETMSSLASGYRHVSDIVLDDAENPSYRPDSAYYPSSVSTYVGLKTDTNQSTVDFDYISIENISSEVIQEVLENFNESDTLYDCTPNIIEVVVDNINDSNLFHGSSSVDFSFANVYYIYTEFTGAANPDYTKRFYRDGVAADATREDFAELEIISGLIDRINEINANENLGTSGIDDFGSFGEVKLTRVSNLVADIASNISESYILNKADARNFLDDYRSDPSSPKLTVFEQVMKKLYVDIGLSDYAYDAAYDISYSSSNEKLIANIKDMTEQDLSNVINAVGFSNTWDDEINSLMVFVKGVSKIITTGNVTNTFTLDVNDPDFTPELIGSLMNQINHIDVTHDALPKFVATSLETLNLERYSTYSGVDGANYYLTQRQYAGAGGIDSVVDVLSAISIKDGEGKHAGYFAFTGASTMKTFVDGGRSTSSILKFVYEFLIYDEPLLLNDGTTVTNDAHFVYRIYQEAELDDYIFGSTVDKKINLFEKIIHEEATFGAFSYEIEGKSTDILLENSSGFVSSEASFDPESLSSVSAIKRPLYESLIGTLGHEEGGAFVEFAPHRAYLTSEIMTGVLDRVAVAEEDKIIGILDSQKAVYKLKSGSITNEKVTSYADFGADSYKLLTLQEAKAIYGVLSVYKGNNLAAYMTAERYNADFDNLGFINAFNLMEYEMNGNIQNSPLASLIYAADLRNVFDPLWNPLNPTPPVVSNPTITELCDYTIGFVSLGEAIADSIGLV